MHLIYMACPGSRSGPSPSLRTMFDKALEPLGDFSVRWLMRPGMSEVFRQWGRSLRRPGGRVLPALLDAEPGRPGACVSTVSLVAYSAGYGFGAELFKHPDDRAAVNACVLLDGIHASWEKHPDGSRSPSDAMLQPFADYAKRAAAGDALFWLGHTDVDPPYPSTTECADELRKMAGQPKAGWYIRAYDDFKNEATEHGQALVGWGPRFTAEALVPYLGYSEPKPPTWLDPSLTLGERCVEWSRAELAAGVRERPKGSNDSPRIRTYRIGNMRRDQFGVERPLNPGACKWCALGACAAHDAVLLPGEKPVHPHRCSGVELEQDAARAGTLRPISLVLSGEWEPEEGDLLTYDRGTPGAPWRRHVVRYIKRTGTMTFHAIGANESDRWNEKGERRFDDPALLYFVEYPRAEAEQLGLDAETAGRMYEVSRAVELGRTELEDALAELDRTGVA